MASAFKEPKELSLQDIMQQAAQTMYLVQEAQELQKRLKAPELQPSLAEHFFKAQRGPIWEAHAEKRNQIKILQDRQKSLASHFALNNQQDMLKAVFVPMKDEELSQMAQKYMAGIMQINRGKAQAAAPYLEAMSPQAQLDFPTLGASRGAELFKGMGPTQRPTSTGERSGNISAALADPNQAPAMALAIQQYLGKDAIGAVQEQQKLSQSYVDPAQKQADRDLFRRDKESEIAARTSTGALNREKFTADQQKEQATQQRMEAFTSEDQASLTSPSTSVRRTAIINRGTVMQIPAPLTSAILGNEGGSPSAVSSQGAVGDMQIMPSTALSEYGITPEQLKDPEVKTMAGLRYLRDLSTPGGKYYKNTQGKPEAVMAAYFSGPGNVANGVVKDWTKHDGTDGKQGTTVRQYVDQGMKRYNQALAASQGGQQVTQSPPRGQRTPGNIDLAARPQVELPDGSTATIRSISIHEDDRDGGIEVLIPTISDDGKVLADKDAIALYKKTGKHLGKFYTPRQAKEYAEQLSKDQERQYVGTEDQAPLTYTRLPKAGQTLSGDSLSINPDKTRQETAEFNLDQTMHSQPLRLPEMLALAASRGGSPSSPRLQIYQDAYTRAAMQQALRDPSLTSAPLGERYQTAMDKASQTHPELFNTKLAQEMTPPGTQSQEQARGTVVGTAQGKQSEAFKTATKQESDDRILEAVEKQEALAEQFLDQPIINATELAHYPGAPEGTTRRDLIKRQAIPKSPTSQKDAQAAQEAIAIVNELEKRFTSTRPGELFPSVTRFVRSQTTARMNLEKEAETFEMFRKGRAQLLSRVLSGADTRFSETEMKAMEESIPGLYTRASAAKDIFHSMRVTIQNRLGTPSAATGPSGPSDPQGQPGGTLTPEARKALEDRVKQRFPAGAR